MDIFYQTVKRAFDQGYFIYAFQVLKKNYMSMHNTFCKVFSKNFQKWAQKRREKKKTTNKAKEKEKGRYCIKHSGH